jgi:hypothetical protein
MKSNKKTKKQIKYLEKEFYKIIDIIGDISGEFESVIRIKPQGSDFFFDYDFSILEDIKKFYIDYSDTNEHFINRIENFLRDSNLIDNYYLSIAVSNLIYSEIKHSENQIVIKKI